MNPGTTKPSTTQTWTKMFATASYSLGGWGSFIDALRQHYENDSELPALVNDPSVPKPSLDNCFVNLALIEQIEQEKQEKALTQGQVATEAALERGELYQSLLMSGSFRGVETLFGELHRSQPTGWVCIQGRAGTGKTTLLQYIGHRWGKRESLWNNRFDFMFRVKLNLMGQKHFWDGLSDHTDLGRLAWLIHQGLTTGNKNASNVSAFSLSNIQQCLTKFPNKILLSLDGFDEIQSLYRTDDRVTGLVDKAMSFPNGILTSRPNAVPGPWLIKDKDRGGRFVQQFENIGLTEANVCHYVQRYFAAANRPQAGDSLLAELSTQPQMMQLAQIPVNIVALCLTWETATLQNVLQPDSASASSASTSNASSGFTMTLLYHRVLLWLARRYLQSRLSPEDIAQGFNPAEALPANILKRCQRELDTLSALAYDAFTRNEVQSLSPDLLTEHFPLDTSDELLYRLRNQFGVLRSFSIPEKEGKHSRHYFIHLTYQEYFTALYIAQKLSIPESTDRAQEMQRRQTIQTLALQITEERNNPKYAVVWTFLAGLISTPEYSKGADYVWDTLIAAPEAITSSVIIGLHPHAKALQKQQHLWREAVLTHRATQNKRLLPTRLQALQTHALALWQWHQACQARVLLPLFDYDEEKKEERDTPITKKAKQRQQQYQSDRKTLALEDMPQVSLSLLFTGDSAWKTILQRLHDALEDEDWDIRVAAAHALGQLGANNAKTLDVLTAAVMRRRDTYQHVCTIANAHALRQLGTNETEILNNFRTDALQGTDQYIRSSNAHVLGQLGTNDIETLNLLRAALQDTNWGVRSDAAHALGRLGANDTETLNCLRAALKDRDSSVRSDAAHALGQLGANDTETLNLLRAALQDTNWGVRSDAAHVLGQLGTNDIETLNLLHNTLQDTNPNVYRAAAAAARSLAHLAHFCQDVAVLQSLLKVIAMPLDTTEKVTANTEMQHYARMAAFYARLPTLMTKTAQSYFVNFVNAAMQRYARIALLRFSPGVYARLPALVTEPTAQFYFVRAVWLQRRTVCVDGNRFIIENECVTLTGTPTEQQAFIAAFQNEQAQFIAAMASLSPELPGILQTLTQPVVLPRVTNVFEPSFLSDNLPEIPVDKVHASIQAFWDRLTQMQMQMTSASAVTHDLKKELERVGIDLGDLNSQVMTLKNQAGNAVSGEELDDCMQKIATMQALYSKLGKASNFSSATAAGNLSIFPPPKPLKPKVSNLNTLATNQPPVIRKHG